jgi:hypothetical protein
MSNANSASTPSEIPTNSEHFVLNWLSRPDNSGYRMKGSQSFESREKAIGFMTARIGMGHVFTSLHKESIVIDDLTAEVSDLFEPGAAV